MTSLDAPAPDPATAWPRGARGYRYPGSPPFGDSDLDRLVFRGREAEADAVLHAILSRDLYVIFGASGNGKTSLLNAGVFEPLRERNLWPFVIRLNDPGSRLIDLVADGLHENALAHPEIDLTRHPSASGDTPDTLWDLLSTLEVWRGNVLQKPVLVFDQFEELFTLDFGERERREFIVDLGEVVRRHRLPGRQPTDPTALRLPAPDVKIVLTLREDSLGELEALSTHVPQIMRNRFRVRGLELEPARRAVVEPAAATDQRLTSHRFTYTDDAADLVLEFLRTREVRGGTELATRVDPSQLQIICQHVERAILPRRLAGAADDQVIEITSDDLGGSEGLNSILRDFYKSEIAALDPEDRDKARALCEAGLISRSGRRLSLEEGEIEVDYGVDRELLQELIDRRLLRAEPRVGSVYYELAHDTLVAGIQEQGRQWTTLREQEEQARKRAVTLDRWALWLGVANIPLFGLLTGPLAAIAAIALRSPPTDRGGRWRSKFALGVVLVWQAVYAIWGLSGSLSPAASDGLYDGTPVAVRLALLVLLGAQQTIGLAVGLVWRIRGQPGRQRWRWLVGTLSAALLLAGVAAVSLASPPADLGLKPTEQVDDAVGSGEAPIVVGAGTVTNSPVTVDIPEFGAVQQELDVTEPALLTIEVIGEGEVDPVLAVLEGDVEIAWDDDGAGNLNSRLEVELDRGAYSIEVFEYSGLAGRATIQVVVGSTAPDPALVPDDADPNEPNDSAVDATPIESEARGAIGPAADHDWFVLSHPGGALVASVSGCDIDGSDTFLTLWESDAATGVAVNDDASEFDLCSTITVDDLPAGDYYLTVESFDPAATVESYTLTIRDRSA